MKHSISFIFQFVIVAAIAIAVTPSFGQDQAADPAIAAAPSAAPDPEPTEDSPEPVTTADPEIPVEYLDLLLEPLTRDELLVEVTAWRDLLKNKIQTISEAEIKSRFSNDLNEAADTAVGANQANEEEARADDLETLALLREEKSALTDHLNVAIDAYEEKGGDPAEFRQYVLATLGIQVDFTDTTALRAAVKGWLISENGGRLVLRKLLLFVAVLAAFWILSAFIGRLVRKAVDRQAGLSDLLKKFINTMTKRIILFVGLLVAISALGVNVSALFALVGGGAFVIGFALQDTLSNFAAGVMVLIYRPFDVGDFVNVGGVEGKVDNVSLVSTTIRTVDNKSVLVPNQSVWGQVITNSTANDERRVDLIFGIGYDDDIEKAQEILEQLVDGHELILKTPEPVIKVHELADSSVNFVCRPWTKTDDYWDVYWDLTRQVKEAFDANGISIPYPQQDVHYSGGG